MLSIPHMIVVFLVVLVVFGPQKLPELARSFGKLMAEFRKASSDFKNAFEEEMRDLERQARIAELKKQVAEANAAADAAIRGTGNPPASPSPGVPTTPLAQAAAQSQVGDIQISKPAEESIPRLDAPAPETQAPQATPAPAPDAPQAEQTEPAQQAEPAASSENPPSHDQHQSA